MPEQPDLQAEIRQLRQDIYLLFQLQFLNRSDEVRQILEDRFNR